MANTREILEHLDEKIKKVQSSKEFKDILEFFSKFHNYSYQNTMLIKMQYLDATYVAGYRQWKKKFNRHVKKGEKGIAILAPFQYNKEITEKKKSENDKGEIIEKEVKKTKTKTYFKTVYVFDVSQTEGEPIPKIDTSLNNDLGEIFSPLLDFALREGIEVEQKDLPEGTKGNSQLGKIVIEKNKNNTEKASILLHELAHELLHDKEERLNLSKEIKELEAESVCFVVMNNFNIETKSDKYMALYKKTYDLKESLNRIKKISRRLINYLEQNINTKEKKIS